MSSPTVPVSVRAVARARLAGLSDAIAAWLDAPAANDAASPRAPGLGATPWVGLDVPTYRRRRIRIAELDSTAG